jgi:hypothetical protein
MTPVTALAPRTLWPVALAGGAALMLGAWLWPQANSPGMYRLVLHAPVQPGAFYLSAWNEGDVFAAVDARDPKPLVFTRHAIEHDGCSWTGLESLEPLTATTYHYSYEETVDSCRLGAVPFVKTPRAGFVTLERADSDTSPTELAGEQSATELPDPAGIDDDDDCDCQVFDEDDADDSEARDVVEVDTVEVL